MSISKKITYKQFKQGDTLPAEKVNEIQQCIQADEVTIEAVEKKTNAIEQDLSNVYNTEEIDTMLQDKEDVLIWDIKPVKDSENPITSGGMFTTLKDYIKKSEFVNESFHFVGVVEHNGSPIDFPYMNDGDVAYVALGGGFYNNNPNVNYTFMINPSWGNSLQIYESEYLNGKLPLIIQENSATIMLSYNGQEKEFIIIKNNGDSWELDKNICDELGISETTSYVEIKITQISNNYIMVSQGDLVAKTKCGLIFLERNVDLSNYQQKLTFDDTPTENSTNPVTSGGVYNTKIVLETAIGEVDSRLSDKIDTKADTNSVYTKTQTDDIIKSKMSTVYKIKGSKDDKNLNLMGRSNHPEVGDVYNVLGICNNGEIGSAFSFDSLNITPVSVAFTSTKKVKFIFEDASQAYSAQQNLVNSLLDSIYVIQSGEWIDYKIETYSVDVTEFSLNLTLTDEEIDYTTKIPEGFSQKFVVVEDDNVVWTEFGWDKLSGTIDVNLTQVSESLPAPTEGTSILNTQTEYYLGEQTSLDFKYPIAAKMGDYIYIQFKSGEVATELNIRGDNLIGDIEVVPIANSYVEIFANYNGEKWIIQYLMY